MSNKEKDLASKLEKISKLPSPPKVAFQIVEVTRDETKGASELADIVSLDQAISAKVLQVANSSTYARSRTAVSIKDAINVLGCNTIGILSLAFSLKRTINPSTSGQLTSRYTLDPLCCNGRICS